MKARELMHSPVVSIPPDAPVWRISAILLENHIGGAPVVDENGSPIGMVSDGDLIGRDEARRRVRWDWWLALMAGGKDLDPELLSKAVHRVAGDVMSAPVITIGEDADSDEIARLMTTHHIKRLPVVRAGRICGIVTRGDLQRAIVQEPHPASAPAPKGFLENAIAAIDQRFAAHATDKPEMRTAAPQSEDENLTVSDFRELVADFEHKEVEERAEAHQAAMERRRGRVAALIDRHITDENWRLLIHQARQAAEHGQKSSLLLRFPSELCSDGSRAINVGEADWPASLRGEAAEIYLRWARDLKPRGFHLSARVVDFPDGLPGDVGLFLVWGDQEALPG